MNWYGNGMGGGSGFWLLMMLFWVVLLAVIVFAVIRLLPGNGRADAAGSAVPAPGVESPDQILDRMFATGEIDEQTYRARRSALMQMRKPS